MLDGATGTQLQKRGLARGECPEAWILKHPREIVEIQREYVKAGSDAIYAPTFGANRASLARYGVSAKVRDIVRPLVELSREAADGAALVGGDLAPTGMQFYPAGETAFEEFVDVFTEQAFELEDAGVDFFTVETQMSLLEARAAVIAARSVSSKPILVSFAPTASGDALMGGDIASALVTLQDMGVAAFGINCCGDLELLRALISRLRPFADVPIIAKPNAGMPEFRDGTAHYNMSAEALAAAATGFFDAGARIFGGCCGTTEEHISALKETLGGRNADRLSAVQRQVCASNWQIITLDGDIDVRDLTLDEKAEEQADALTEDGAELFYVRVRNEREFEILTENQMTIKLPLCVECPDGELASKILRLYNGKPIII